MHSASRTLLTGANEVLSVVVHSFRRYCVELGTVDVEE